MIWLPNNETQLRDALDQGLLNERHTLDFKRALPAGKGKNTELAKDLAQFAIDGGVLIIGVDDNDKTVPPKLTPVDLDGLKERVDNVARSIPDPPMHVRTDEIPIAGTTTGYLFIEVPSTPYEPRQVDGVYYGRADTTRYRLPAAEVERCYQLGLRIQRDITTLLDEAVQNDPWQEGRHAHLFGVAQPVSPRSDLLLHVVGTRVEAWRNFLLMQIRPQSPRDLWRPDLPDATEVSRRAWGWALGTHEMPGPVVDQSIEHRETRLLDLEVREDGGLRLFCGGASRTFSGPLDPIQIVMDLVIVGLTKRLIMAAATVADTADFSGSWDLGIAVIGLGGLRRHRTGSFPSDEVPYSEHDYRQTTRATHERLTQQPDSVVEDLTGRLHRGLGGGPEINPF
jgi:Schlafen, AlbA_2